MPVRLFHNNHVFDALPSASITPSSQQQNLPAINVQNSFRSRVWRTGTSTATETLTIDMGAAVTIDAVIIFFTTIDTILGGDSSVIVMGNTANAWVGAAFTASLAQGSITDASTGVAENYFFSDFGVSPGSPTFRWWRISFTKASAGVTRDIGRVFLGQTYDVTQNISYNGIQIVSVDNSNKSKGVGMNTFVEILPQHKQVTLNWPLLPQVDVTNLDSIFYRIGQNTNMYLQIDQITPYNEILYVKHGVDHAKKTKIISPTTQYWDYSSAYEEQL